MNIKQIIDRLNAEFTGDARKLVFWYDDNGEFVEDMQNVELDNAKVYFLQLDNQFATKLLLEQQDTKTNYLIYAPFPKPDVRDNHLEDTMLYSKRFSSRNTSSFSPTKNGPSGSTTWRSRISTKRISSPAFSPPFAVPAPAPSRKLSGSC